MKKVLLLAFVVAALYLGESGTPLISTGAAQSLTINRDGIQIDRRSRRVDRREATRIAQRNGISRVRAVDLRGRHWVVTGETRRGRDILRHDYRRPNRPHCWKALYPSLTLDCLTRTRTDTRLPIVLRVMSMAACRWELRMTRHAFGLAPQPSSQSPHSPSRRRRCRSDGRARRRRYRA